MKILIVSQYFFPENFRINDFAFELSKKGHDVTVLTGLPNYPKGSFFGSYKIFKEEEIKGVKVYRVPLIPRGQSRGWELALNYLSFLISSLLFGAFLVRGKKIDVVFATNYSPATVGITGVFFSKLKNAKMFLWVQDLWPQSLIATKAIENSYFIALIQTMVSWVYMRTTYILIQSEAFRKPILDQKIPNEKIKYFPNWAEDVYRPINKPEMVPERLLIPKEFFIIMFAGNLGIAQSLETIVRAAEKLKEHPIHWVILGDGRERKNFENLISEKDLNEKISTLGSYPVEKMPLFFSMADALLVSLKPDPVFSATIPGKIQSYLKSGKPIIASLDGIGAEVIKESSAGYCSPAGDYEALSKIVLKMSNLSEKQRKKMGEYAQKYYLNHFSSELLILRFENWVYNKSNEI